MLFFMSVNGSLPNYLNEHLTINNTQHNRSTRCASYNSMCPYYKATLKEAVLLLLQDFGIMCL